MLDRLLEIVAPHHCYGCHKSGYVLCPDCKYDITDEFADVCLLCQAPTTAGICAVCRTSYEKAWLVGDRSGVLERTINAYKFERVKSAAATLASLLDARLPVLPPDTMIVPVPTIRTHIRQRGYDHTRLLARELARRRGLKVGSVIKRRGNGVQRGLNKKERFKQAEEAFYCERPLSSSCHYLVLDDVVTTNATLRYACQALLDAGAEVVWAGVLARQELKNSSKRNRVLLTNNHKYDSV